MAPDCTVVVVQRGEERSLLTAVEKGGEDEARPAGVPPASPSPPTRTSPEGCLRLRGRPHRLRGKRLRGRGEELPFRGCSYWWVRGLVGHEALPHSGRSRSRRRARLHHP